MGVELRPNGTKEGKRKISESKFVTQPLNIVSGGQFTNHETKSRAPTGSNGTNHTNTTRKMAKKRKYTRYFALGLKHYDLRLQQLDS